MSTCRSSFADACEVERSGRCLGGEDALWELICHSRKPRVARQTQGRSPEELRLLAVLRALGEHGVRCAVFGAVALGLHGLASTTADLDLFIEPTEDNVERLKAALRSVYADPCIDEIDELSKLLGGRGYLVPIC